VTSNAVPSADNTLPSNSTWVQTNLREMVEHRYKFQCKMNDRKSSLKSTARSSAVTHKLLPSSNQSYMANPEGM